MPVNTTVKNNANVAGDIKCDTPLNASGSEWDVVCFGFLLIQRRIFSSHYFRHVVDLLEAQSRLASRCVQQMMCYFVQKKEDIFKALTDLE